MILYAERFLTNLSTAVLDLGEQVEAVTDGDRGLAGHEPHPHQSQADPRQPILTRLTVGVEKSSNALERTDHTMCV